MEQSRRSLWIVIGIIIAVLGIGLSLYSTAHHLEVHATGHTDAVCNINQTFSCDSVALSKYSEVAGIPLGVLGLGYFAAMAVLLGIALKNGKTAAEHLHGYVLLVAIGLLTSLVLAAISIGSLGTYCLTCIAVYTLTIAQAVVLFLGRRDLVPAGFTLKSAANGATTAAIAVAVVVAGFNFLKPTHTPSNAATEQANPDKPQLAPTTAEIPITKSAYAGLGEDYRKGSDTAKVVLVEFADFQCPACGAMAKSLHQLGQEYGDRILIVFRNYPLDNSCNSAIQGKMHEFSCKAAVMARCAGQYGHFWPYFDKTFEQQKDINEANLKKWAKEAGLTQEQIDTCWTSNDLLAKVKDDIDLGNKLGIDSTPTLYINGHKVVGGRGMPDLRAAIDQQLAE